MSGVFPDTARLLAYRLVDRISLLSCWLYLVVLVFVFVFAIIFFISVLMWCSFDFVVSFWLLGLFCVIRFFLCFFFLTNTATFKLYPLYLRAALPFLTRKPNTAFLYPIPSLAGLP